MKAMLCRAWGAPDVLRLEDIPPQALRPGEVRIRVRAAGVNFADSLMIGGTYQVKPPFPFTPGLEAAGEVSETGSGVVGLRTGQRVLAVLRNGGGYAEEIMLDAATVVPIPETMDFVTAAAFPVAYGNLAFCADPTARPNSCRTRPRADPGRRPGIPRWLRRGSRQCRGHSQAMPAIDCPEFWALPDKP